MGRKWDFELDEYIDESRYVYTAKTIKSKSHTLETRTRTRTRAK